MPGAVMIGTRCACNNYMPKAFLSFSLPEESDLFKQASRSGELVSALESISNILRRRLKHEEPSEEEVAVLNELWESIPWDVIND